MKHTLNLFGAFALVLMCQFAMVATVIYTLNLCVFEDYSVGTCYPDAPVSFGHGFIGLLF